MNKNYPELHDFFGAYFHQDWTAEHETPEEVINAFLAESGVENIQLVQQELNALLAQSKEESELRGYLLQELSCYYSYWNAWESGESWLRHIVNRLGNQI